MSMRLITACLGMLVAAFAATGTAQARSIYDAQTSNYRSVAKAKVSKAYRASSNRAAKTRSAKGASKYRSSKSNYRSKSSRKYRSAKSYKRSGTKTGRRYASRSRSYGGGTSRSCLSSQARSLLSRIESNFGPVQIVSTCRPGAVIATSGKPSKHRHGQAIDFDAGARKGAIVKWLIANHHSGGTMTYRNMGHIHVDVGYRFVKLGANSGRG